MNLVATVNMSPFNSAGPVDDRMLFVYTWIFWASVVLGVVVAALLMYSFFRFRRKSDDEEPEQTHGNTRLEITWTAIPFAILFGLFILTATNMPFINNQNTAANALNYKVEGQQFSWTTTYPGGQKSLNTIIVPINTPVNISLTSSDVIHSLFVPNVAGQMNAMPGQPNSFWIEVSQPGVWYGQCTELCGVGHHLMVVAVIGLPADQFHSCITGTGPMGLDDIKKGRNPNCAPAGGGF